VITLKQKITDLFKNNGYYFLAAACIIALAAAIGIISTNTSKEDSAENAAGFTDAQTDEMTENTQENNEEVAANSGLDYTDGYDADQIQDIITKIEEGQAAANENTQTGTGSDTNTQTAADTNDNTQTAADSTGNTSGENAAAASAQTANAFDESQHLAWPVYGDLLMDYSMNTTTYFKTLDQYKCNPGLLIAADVNSEVHCAYSGTVESIRGDSEHGQTVTVNMGNDFRAVYGQLKDISVSEGDTVATGSLIGHVAEPTKYFIEEGSHLYFELTKDEIPADPKVFLESK